ncbi:MAG: Asp-tRNA(Asn)/Glu-tRNA(Gln) amidotransferase subunit GatA [Candidatus Pacebacteria bacterium]|nr:Asp-tRNA(Asn)/Glu-tRNA(Gln) amidotransferase subunit GatA [Candidatus Paceibacterota bacterium]MDD5357087.1 Asp-tRNA(Asn)/Glu-tRNA(Gln) amidotransferase subunit GatA [Candidatus Paceibacterota bacterium]
MKINLENLTIKSAHDALVHGDFTAVELAETYLAEIKKKNTDLNAYLEIYDDVLLQAKEADKIMKSGKAGMLTGIPLAIKDNILIKGRTASSASKMLEKYLATYDATAIEKLKKSGAVFLGRTNMDEFALGGSTENSAFGVTKNSHDATRVAGGTSGGSAVAVASSIALASLGSDTGGSIRQPASFNGVVGLKPTYGAVSRSGLMAAVSSFDQIGPITKTVTDAEILFHAIRGKDVLDGTTIDEGTYPKLPLKGKKKSIIGVPFSFMKQGGIEKDVLANLDESVKKLESLGHEVKDISLPSMKYCLSVYYILNFAEVSSNLARFDGVKYGLHSEGDNLTKDYFQTRAFGFGKEVRQRIILGTYVLSTGYYDAYYNKANIVRGLLKEDFRKAFETVDLILTPTTPSPAFKIGEKANDPVQMYLADIFTVTANLVGTPAISVPSGFSKTKEGKNLPLGIQFTANHGREELLFAVGKEFLGE